MHTAMQTARYVAIHPLLAYPLNHLSFRQSASHRAWQELPRHLRRRAASHDVRRVPLRLRDKAKAEVN